jgi:nucleotide-binding universal stress UspA family protein
MRTTTTPSTAPASTGAYHAAVPSGGPILLATAGEGDLRAIDAARLLAARGGAPVVVLSALEPPIPVMTGLDGATAWTPDYDDYVAAQRHAVERRLGETLGPGVDWPVEVVVESPSRAIAEAARSRHASLVVIGIGQHDLTARLLSGEIPLRIIRRSPAPVLAVTDEPLRVPAHTAVVAMDFSPSSVRAARAALDLLDDGGTLHLVHVWAREALDVPALAAAREQYERALPGRFARVERLLLDGARSVTILPTTLHGRPAEQLVDFARAHGADLLAAGRSGHGLFERLLVGSVTTGLVRAAPCAVLVTPEPSVAERAELELALTGAAESHRRDEWSALLDAFTRRNRGRRASMEVDDPDLGAQAQESGYTFRGATYDRHDERVTLMLGAPAGRGEGAAHLTRSIDGVTAVAVHGDPSGSDVALAVGRGDGQTLLTFLPDSPANAPAT